MKTPLNSSLPDQNAVSFSLTETVQAALAAFSARPLYLGLSGGLDSVVLLHLLVNDPDLKPRLHAVHVHHGLSVHADDWLQHCQSLCQQLGVPFLSERVQVLNSGEGTEAAARSARYAVFERLLPENAVLLLAQHADESASL